jgi:hypothetical protein
MTMTITRYASATGTCPSWCINTHSSFGEICVSETLSVQPASPLQSPAHHCGRLDEPEAGSFCADGIGVTARSDGDEPLVVFSHGDDYLPGATVDDAEQHAYDILSLIAAIRLG